MVRAPRRRWPAVLAWSLVGLAVLALAAELWLRRRLLALGLPSLAGGGDEVTLVTGALSASVAGAVLASRRPRHPVGWLLLAFGVGSEALVAAADAYGRYGVLARTGSLPGATYVAMFSSVSFVPSLGVVCFILLLTPTGSLPSRRWRPLAWLTAATAFVFGVTWLFGSPTVDPEPPWEATANPFFVPGLGSLFGLAGIAAQASGLLLLAAAVSLVVRYRRAGGVERQQLRWLTAAAALAPVAVALVVAGIVTGREALANWAAGLYLSLLPATIAAAIARYRLYDLDRIISRTVAYGLLTLLLGLGYAVVTLGLGQLLGERGNSLVVAGTTLAVAAAFQPARRRVQGAVDRRFDRRRYDAALTIAAFSTRLRDQVDLDTLAGELVGVVERTMQPTATTLWLRIGPGQRPGRGLR